MLLVEAVEGLVDFAEHGDDGALGVALALAEGDEAAQQVEQRVHALALAGLLVLVFESGEDGAEGVV